MNNRANFKDVQDFLKFKKEQKCTKQTINVYDVLLRPAIRWCDEIAFTECFKNKITLPTYCENLVSNGEISDETARRICTTFSEFLSYEALENKQRYKNIKPSFIAGFRYKTYTDNAKIPAYFTLDEMKKIASIQTDDLSMKRSKAAACFMYLSGMR